MKGTLKRLLIVLIAVSMVLMPSTLGFTYADETTGEAVSEEAADVAVAEEGDAAEGPDLSSLHMPKLGEAAAAELADAAEPEAVVSGVITKEELDLMSEAELDQTVRVSIVLSKAPVLDKYSAEKINTFSAKHYRKTLRNQQASVESSINKVINKNLDVKWHLTLAVNVISADVTYRDLKQILTVSGVESVQRENRYEALTGEAGTAEPNTAMTSEYMVGAQAAWADGYTGAGSRVAIIDTGADIDHQSFDSGAFDYAIAKYEEKFGKTVDLMDASDIAAVAEELNGAGEYLNSKMPYIYNYVDGDLDVTHLNDTEGEHGSHVAGIAAANRYIPDGDSYVDSLDGTFAVGMAPDAQILVMKVFGKGGGAYDSDYMAAIEDAIVLECDSCNLSLGTAAAGFTYDTVYQDALNALVETSTVAAISAGNSYDWGNTNSYYGMLYSDSTIFNTVGSPGSYINAFTVAAAENIGVTGAPFKFGDEKVFYTETDSSGAEMMTLDTSEEGTGTEYDFVYIDSKGFAEEYAAVNALVPLKGKIVMVNRGSLTFVEKGNNAIQFQPAAAVVVNNTNGSISMALDDYKGEFPFVSVNGEDRATIVGAATDNKTVTANVTYDFNDDGAITDNEKNVEMTSTVYVGKMTVSGKISAELSGTRENATITGFSSWGVPESLLLKPEITAPGGNIYSVFGMNTTDSGVSGGHDKYELMSGTSMAAPHIAGLSAVIKQYLEENDLGEFNKELTSNYTLRAIAQSLMMSTATPMMDNENELYLPVIQQGAGLVDISKAINASSVVMVDDAFLTTATGAAADGKVKVELGDDPERKGKYEYSFTIYNITNEDQTFELNSDFFTQDLYYYGIFHDTWTTDIDMDVDYDWVTTPKVEGMYVDEHDVDKDGDTDADDAQAILDYLTGVRDDTGLNLKVGDVDEDGKVTTYDAHLILEWTFKDYATKLVVPANGKAHVSVTATLKSDLSDYPAGAYIEGFTYANCVTKTDEGLSLVMSHSIPVLGFYGSWTESSMFDYSSLVDLILYGEDNVWPSYSGNYSNFFLMQQGSSEYVFTGNPYVAEEVPYDRLAMRSDTQIKKVYYNQIRNAAAAGFAVSKLDEKGGISEVLNAALQYIQVYGLYTDTSGTQQNTGTKNYTVGKTPAEYGLKEGDLFRAGYYAIPEYNAMLYNANNGDGTMTAAYDGVLLEDKELADVIAKGDLGPGAYVGYDFIVDDTAPVIKDVALDAENGTVTITASDNEHMAIVGLVSLDGSELYAFDIPEDPEATVELDISEVMNDIPKYAAVFVGDYAGNEAIQLLTVNDNEAEFDDPTAPAEVVLSEEALCIYKGNSATISAEIIPITATNTEVKWTTSNEAVATVSNGTITAVGKGEADITATSAADENVKASCHVTVVSLDGDLKAIAWDFKIEGNDNEAVIQFETDEASKIAAYKPLGDYKGISTTTAFYGLKKEASGVPDTLFAGTFDYSEQTTEIYKLDADYNFVDNKPLTSSLDPYATAYAGVVDAALGYPSSGFGGDMAYVYGPYFILGNGNPDYGQYAGMPNTVGIPFGAFVVHPNFQSANTYFCAVALKGFVESNGDFAPEYYLLDNAGMLWDAVGEWGVDEDGYDVLDFNLTEMFNIGFEPYWLRQSMFYDDALDALFLSNTVTGLGATLYYIDVENELALEVGGFGDDVWPVTGLFNKPESGFVINSASHATFNPNMEKLEANMAEVNAFREKALAESTEGSTNRVVNARPNRGDVADQNVVIPWWYPVNDADEEYCQNMGIYETEDSTNGFVTLNYDKDVLKYKKSELLVDHASILVDEENGVIKVAYADKEVIKSYTDIATFEFQLSEPCQEGELEVVTSERNDEVDLEEAVTAILDSHKWGEWKYDKATETFSRVCEVCKKEATEPFPVRIFGDTRYDTSIEIANEYKEALGIEKFENIVIATGDQFPDALTGSYLSIQYGAPILLINKQAAVMQKAMDYIGANATEDASIFILGGTGVVEESFEKTLAGKGYNVVRLAGEDRFETNLAILGAVEEPGEDLLVCSGLDWPDAATSSATGLPILIVGKALTDDQKAYLEAQNFNNIYVVGGDAVVSEEMLESLKPYAGGVTRVWGENRAATAIAVAEEFFPEQLPTLVFAYYKNFPDCIAGGLLAYSLGAPVLYGPAYLDINKEFVNKCGAWTAYALGGNTLVTTDFFLQAYEQPLLWIYNYQQ